MTSHSLSTRVFLLLTQQSKRHRRLWLTLSLALATVHGLLVLQQAFSSNYVIQDDARQHVFWMQRYLDNALFPNDLIADYFQAAAPPGYAWLYQGIAALGIAPVLLSKLLPPLLGLVTIGYAYFLCLELFPIPAAGFISSAILSHTLWVSDEISSGTPRAFLYPLLIAFLYYLLRQSRLPCLITLALQVLLYPQAALISLSLVAIRLLGWQNGKVSFSRNWQDYLLLGLGACFVLWLVLYRQGLAEFGDIVTRTEAMAMPEFQPEGRNDFFHSGMDYWIKGYPDRSGLFHRKSALPITMVAGVLLPGLLWGTRKQTLASQVRPAAYGLLQLLLVSLGWFILAHLLLFELHLPSRYTSHTIRVILALSAGITWVILLDALFRCCQHWRGRMIAQKHQDILSSILLKISGKLPLFIAVIFLILTCLYYPLLIGNFPKVGYKDFARSGPLYDFLGAQPKAALIASLSEEANNIPTFSGRSVLVAPEYGLAYHKGYYGQFRQRVNDLIAAQYTAVPSEVAAFIEAYGPEFWLLDGNAFAPGYLVEHGWRSQFQPAARNAEAALLAGPQPALQAFIPTCTVFQTDLWTVLAADCIYQQAVREEMDTP